MNKKYLRLDEDVMKTFFPEKSKDEINEKKRNIAFIEVLRRIPEEIYTDIIMRYNRLCLFHLFIPDYNNLGCVYSIPIPKKRNGEVRSEVLYLDPRLEKQDEKIIIAVIAHEIAHIFLKHTTKCYGEKSKAQEKEAWELIRKWGFERESKKYMAFRKNEVNHGKNKKRKKS